MTINEITVIKRWCILIMVSDGQNRLANNLREAQKDEAMQNHLQNCLMGYIGGFEAGYAAAKKEKELKKEQAAE